MRKLCYTILGVLWLGLFAGCDQPKVTYPENPTPPPAGEPDAGPESTAVAIPADPRSPEQSPAANP